MKVLLPIDGSECSKLAIDSAIKLKYGPESELKVISVVDFFEPLPAIEGEKEREIKIIRDLVNNTVRQIKTALPTASISGDVLDGYPKEEIIKVASEWPADLIIMGSHGRTGLAALLLGSTSKAVLQNSPCSVRIIRRPPSDGRLRAQPGFNNVLIAMDNSKHSNHSLEHVLSMYWSENTKFKCITVLPNSIESTLTDPNLDCKTSFAAYQEELHKDAQEWLKSCAKSIESKFGSGCTSYEVLEGDPREKILLQAELWPATLIVCGSHGRRGIERLLLGSVSETISTHAHCSVEVTKVPKQTLEQKAEQKHAVAQRTP